MLFNWQKALEYIQITLFVMLMSSLVITALIVLGMTLHWIIPTIILVCFGIAGLVGGLSN